MTATVQVRNADPPLTPLRPLPPLHKRRTREGICWYRSFPAECFGPVNRFWTDYKNNPRQWVERGFSPHKDGTTWCVQQWLTEKGCLTTVAMERLARIIDPTVQQEMKLEDLEFACPALPEALEAKLYDYQRQPARQLLRALTNGKEEWGYPGAVDLSDMGCHAKGQLIRMADGTNKRVEEIVVGDRVMGWQGPQTVTELKRGHETMVKIIPKHASMPCWQANMSHMMTVWDHGMRALRDMPLRQLINMRMLTDNIELSLLAEDRYFAFDLHVLPPDEFFGFSLDGDGRFLLGCGTITHNTGKTAMSMAAAIATGREIGVLCPVVGRAGWERMFRHFGAEPRFLETYEAVRGGWRPEIVSKRGDGQFWWKKPEDLILILDEAQAVRHDTSLTFEVCDNAIRQQIPMVIASATIATSPIEMRFAGRITGLHSGSHFDFERFLSTHGCCEQGRTWKWSGKNEFLQRIHGRLFPRRGCRVRKEDLGDKCPETVIEVLTLDVDGAEEIERQAKDAEELFARLRKSGVPESQIKMRENVARMALWQRTEEALVEAVAARARRDIAAGRSVAIFMNFDKTRMKMSKLLGNAPGFHGGQPQHLRAKLEAEFQACRIHALVSNIKAGGASVSLHDTTGERPRSAYIFPTDRVVDMVQASGRVDRVGGQSVSEQWIPCVAGTVTERMVKRTRSKMLSIGTLNDGGDARARF